MEVDAADVLQMHRIQRVDLHHVMKIVERGRNPTDDLRAAGDAEAFA